MNLTRRSLVAVLAVGLFLGDRAAVAQRGVWEPFDGITRLVDWFDELNNKFDQLVAKEQRAQLSRSVDRLRTQLYELEADTQALLDSIPDQLPEGQKKSELRVVVNELKIRVAGLGQSVRDIGAELRLAEANQIERRLTFGLRSRRRYLTFVEARIEGRGKWDATEVRDRLNRGLNAVRDAQLAATKFSQQLARK